MWRNEAIRNSEFDWRSGAVHGKGFRGCGLTDPWGRDGTVTLNCSKIKRFEDVFYFRKLWFQIVNITVGNGELDLLGFCRWNFAGQSTVYLGVPRETGRRSRRFHCAVPLDGKHGDSTLDSDAGGRRMGVAGGVFAGAANFGGANGDVEHQLSRLDSGASDWSTVCLLLSGRTVGANKKYGVVLGGGWEEAAVAADAFSGGVDRAVVGVFWGVFRGGHCQRSCQELS